MINLYSFSQIATKPQSQLVPSVSATWLFACLTIWLLPSCHKTDEPQVTEPEPVFYIKADIYSDSLDIKAGKNNYYMYSSYSLDSNDVFNFSGEFKQTDCSDCRNTLKISFDNYKVDATPASAIDAGSFPISYIPFAMPGGVPASYSVKFTPLTSGGQPLSYLWDFGDGTTSTDASPTHIYNITGIYEVGLNVTYASGCSSNISNPLNCGVSALACDAGFILSSVDTTTVNLTSSPGGNPPFTYDWDFGDGSPHDNSPNPSHTYATSGVYQVCLTTTSIDSCTNTRCLNVATENPGTCSIRYSSTVTAITNPFNLSTAFVEWTDATGKVYTSKNSGQYPSSYFKINSVEDYDNNENGAKTKKLNVSFSFVLFTQGDAFLVTNGEAVIAVAYPQ